MNWVEIIGYVASVCVAVSLLMVSIVRLRIINLIGCIIFAAYGLVIGAIPIVVTNGFIAVVNSFFLYKIFFRNIEAFSYIPISGDRREVLDHFIRTNEKEIALHYPLFQESMVETYLNKGGTAFLAFRELSLVGFAVIAPAESVRDAGSRIEKKVISEGCASIGAENCLYLVIDYIAKPYRDMGVAAKLHDKIVDTADQGKVFLIAIAEREKKRHGRFLRLNGFQHSYYSDQHQLYAKNLKGHR